MEVTETTINLVQPPSLGRDGVVAFASITLDQSLVIKGIRLVRVRGRVLAGMPNKERQRPCESCSSKNDITNKYCHSCGHSLTRLDVEERIYIDMVHPITLELRNHIEGVLIRLYEERLNASSPNSPS